MNKIPILDDYIDTISQSKDKKMIDNIIKSTITKRKIFYDSDEESIGEKENDENEIEDNENDIEIVFVDDEISKNKKTFIEKLEDENIEMISEINIEEENIKNEIEKENIKIEIEKKDIKNEIGEKDIKNEKEEKEEKKLPISDKDYIDHKNNIDQYETNNRVKLFIKNTLNNAEKRLDQSGKLKTNVLMINQFEICKDLILYFQYHIKKDDLEKKLKQYNLII